MGPSWNWDSIECDGIALYSLSPEIAEKDPVSSHGELHPIFSELSCTLQSSSHVHLTTRKIWELWRLMIMSLDLYSEMQSWRKSSLNLIGTMHCTLLTVTFTEFVVFPVLHVSIGLGWWFPIQSSLPTELSVNSWDRTPGELAESWVWKRTCKKHPSFLKV